MTPLSGEEPPRVIETARLRLRFPAAADVDAIFEYASDPEVTDFMDWRRLTEVSEAAGFVGRTEDGWRSGWEFTWVITERAHDVVIGAIAIRPRMDDVDFGYVLSRRCWGRGYATEAAIAVVAWARSRGFNRIWATCDVENVRSQRVLEKLGLRREGLLPGGVVRPNRSDTPQDTYVYEFKPPIAERRLICQRAGGERIAVMLSIGRPYFTGAVEWACSAEARGLAGPLPDMRGVDSLQALILAQGLLRNLVEAELAKGSTLHWEGGGEPMTVEELFGKTGAG